MQDWTVQDDHGPRDRTTSSYRENNYLNRLDEAFGLLCAHISMDLLFHLEGLKTPKEAWEKLEFLFGKQDELQGHILENELISL